jgi:hypothetical protein
VRTIDCDLARERVSLQLDGELSFHELVLLERHLSGCLACAAFASDTRGYTELIRSAPLEEPPGLVLPRRTRARRLAVGVGAGVASTAAAAIVALSALSVTKPSGAHPGVALVFVPAASVAVKRPQGLRHPSAAAGSPQLTLLDAPRHDAVSP